jgi:hypothetical protein
LNHPAVATNGGAAAAEQNQLSKEQGVHVSSSSGLAMPDAVVAVELTS